MITTVDMISMDFPTMEDMLKKSPLQSIRDFASQHAIFGNVEITSLNGSVMTRNQFHRAMKREEVLLDRLTLEMAVHERSLLNPREFLPEWLIKAEHDSFQRQAFKGRQNEVV